MNLMKRSLVDGEIRGEVRASKGVGASVGALLLPALNPRTGPWPASSSDSSVRLARRLT